MVQIYRRFYICSRSNNLPIKQREIMSQQRNQEIPLWANTSQQNSKMSQRQFNITRPTLINTSPTRVKTILTWTKTSQRELNNPKKCDVLKNVKFGHGKPTSLLLFQTWNQFNYLEFLVLNFARFWPPPIYVCLIQNNFSVERITGTWLKELLGWFGCKIFLK